MVASSKLLTLFIVPMVTGTVSFVSSSSLMFCILVYSQIKLQKVVRRILFMFCIYDCIYSLAAALAIFLTPKWASEYALGNLITCDIQGFMFTFGFAGSVFYTLSLALYYVAVIKFNRKEKDISNKLFEYLLHLVPNGYALYLSIFLAVKRQYGPGPTGYACFVGNFPENCATDPDVECERGGPMIQEYAMWFGVIPFLLIYFLVFCTMMIICRHIIKQKRRVDRWRMQSEDRDQCKSCCFFPKRQKPGALHESTGDKPLSPGQEKFLKMQQALSKKPNTSSDNTRFQFAGPSASRSGTKQDPLAFNVRQVKKKIRRESMLDPDAPIILSNNISHEIPLRSSLHTSRRRQTRDENMAITQCMLYVSSFLLCWIFNLIARIIQITRNPVPFTLLVLARFFNPLQGFFFILVYSRPHVKAIRKSEPELNWFQAFAVAFKAGGDNDFGDYQLEVDEEGIDAPRLRDKERERRQEIVRQQYKRKSVTYRLSCATSPLRPEGNNPNVFNINDIVVDGTFKGDDLERSHASNDEDAEAIISSKRYKDEVDDIEV